MIIRRATREDIPFLLTEGIKFIQYHPANFSKEVDSNYLIEIGLNLIDNHVVFIAEENNKSLGMIAGMVVPNLYNPKFTILQEFFWWIKEEYRNTKAAFKLFSAFEKEAIKLKVNSIVMVSTAYTPQLERIYKHKNYRPIEYAFMKEI